ncbi:MAG TPA: hypothetical protein DHW02_21095, partial [Ktedonobacter sp.]|nr:hypothetical protein [Ktedonobacter sp.]
SQVGDALQFTYNGIPSPLTHVHYDIFELNLERFEYKTRVSFVMDVNGNIESLTVLLEPTVKAQVFTHMPDLATT